MTTRPSTADGGFRRFSAMLSIIVGAAAAALLANAIRPLGHSIRQDLIERDYMVALVWAGVLGASLWLWPVIPEERRALSRLWLAKCFVALVVMLFYEWNYSLDSYGYFEVARQPDLSGLSLGLGRGVDNIAAVAWLQFRVLPESFHALKLSFAMIGLVAIYATYRAAVIFLGKPDVRILYLLGFFPSILFWSSILGKDPVQFLGIALYVYGTIGLVRRHQARYAIWFVLGVGISVLVRVWSGPVMLFPLIVLPIAGARGVGRRIALTALLLVGMGLVLYPVTTYFKLEAAQDIVTRADAFTHGWAGGSTIDTPTQFTSFGSMLRFAPRGAFTALFRPLPGEVMNPFGLLAGLESFCLLLLAIGAFVNGRGERIRDRLVWWSVLFIVTWSVAYGFISYNLGAVARFKLQILPVLLLTLGYLAGLGPQSKTE